QSQYCENGGAEHPIARYLANQYDHAYTEILDWYCEGRQFGEIMLALATSDEYDGATGDVLALRAEVRGWAQVWQLLNNSEKRGTPSDVDVPPSIPGSPQEPRSSPSPTITSEAGGSSTQPTPTLTTQPTPTPSSSPTPTTTSISRTPTPRPTLT